MCWNYDEGPAIPGFTLLTKSNFGCTNANPITAADLLAREQYLELANSDGGGRGNEMSDGTFDADCKTRSLADAIKENKTKIKILIPEKSFDDLMAQYDALLAENERLKAKLREIQDEVASTTNVGDGRGNGFCFLQGALHRILTITELEVPE